MSIDFSAIVDGLFITAASVKGLHQQTFVQSGYQADGSDFAGFAKAGASVSSAATFWIGPSDPGGTEKLRVNGAVRLVPGVTDGAEVDAILVKSNSTGHGDWGISFASLLFANGHYDPIMAWGYNFNPGGSRPLSSEPGWQWQLESDYDDGAHHQCETYIAYQSANGLFNTRPIMVQTNRDLNTTTVALVGAISLSGWVATNGSVLTDTLTITQQYVFLRSTGVPGTAPTQFVIEGNNRQWAVQDANPLGPNAGLSIRLPYIDASDRIYCAGDTYINGNLTIAGSITGLTFTNLTVSNSLNVGNSGLVGPAVLQGNGVITISTFPGQGMVLDSTQMDPATVGTPLKNSPPISFQGSYFSGGTLHFQTGGAVRGFVIDGSNYGLQWEAPFGIQRLTLDSTGLFTVSFGLKHGGNLGFFNTVPVAKQTVTGSKSANAALASLLTALAAYGIVTDSST